MLAKQTISWQAVLLPLLAATVVNAVPTTSEYDGHSIVCASVLNRHLATPSARGMAIDQIGEIRNLGLAGIVGESVKPPVGFTDPEALPICARPLPPVPGSLSMGLTGLLCASVIKSRKVWMAALAAILWAGQAGFGALPQFVSHLRTKKQVEQLSAANISYVRGREDSARLRSDIESTQYIGLLHHLAGIPEVTMSLPFAPALVRAQRAFSPQRGRAGNDLSLPSDRRLATKTEYKFIALQFAIKDALSDLIQVTNCLPQIAEQPICFSPGFIFRSLARAPP